MDRISFDALLPGASINIGGDLNTLDVLNGITLVKGNTIDIGRDLNLLNVGQNLDLSGGGSIIVHRFMGTTPQPPKGTATGSNILALNQALVGTGTSTIVPSLTAYIQGNMNLGTAWHVHGGRRDSKRYAHQYHVGNNLRLSGQRQRDRVLPRPKRQRHRAGHPHPQRLAFHDVNVSWNGYPRELHRPERLR